MMFVMITGPHRLLSGQLQKLGGLKELGGRDRVVGENKGVEWER